VEVKGFKRSLLGPAEGDVTDGIRKKKGMREGNGKIWDLIDHDDTAMLFLPQFYPHTNTGHVQSTIY
jgi:hypothetical protein